MTTIQDLDSQLAALQNSILGTIESIEARLPEAPNVNDYNENKIRATVNILRSLGEFGTEYYEYFQNPAFIFRPDYSLINILSTIIAQMGHDLQTLSRVAHEQFNRPAQDVLKKVDTLADAALDRAIELGWLENRPVVISYLQKSPSIRVLPYVDALLLGIPYSIESVNTTHLAIPHEVGHYIFWQGRVDGVPIMRQLLGEIDRTPEFSFRWLEEIFADIFGAFVAGPFIALSFQDLQLIGSPGDFVEDDGEHPVRNLRPYLYNKALKYFGQEQSARRLNSLWQRRLNEYQINHPLSRPFNRIFYDCNTSQSMETMVDTEGQIIELGAVRSGLDIGDAEPVDSIMSTILNLYKELVNKGPAENLWNNVSPNLEADIVNQRVEDVREFLNNLFNSYIDTDVVERANNGSDIQQITLQNIRQYFVPEGTPTQQEWPYLWPDIGWTTEGPQCPASPLPCG